MRLFSKLVRAIWVCGPFVFLNGCTVVSEIGGAIAEACGRPSVEVTTTADLRRPCTDSECSLWGAINLANTCNNGMAVQMQDGARYHVDSRLAATPPPPAGTVYPPITGQLTVVGNGATIVRTSRVPFERFFLIQSRGDLAISDLTLEGGGDREGDRGRRASEGGAIINRGTLTLENVNTVANQSGLYGGAILNTGYLLVRGGEHRGNQTGGGCEGAGGGFLLNKPDASAGIHDALVHDNLGSCGGGIVNEGILAIVDSTFRGNTAGTGDNNIYAHGGALWNGSEDENEALAMIVRSTFSSNRAMVGGAIVNDRRARMYMNTSTVSGNETYTPCIRCDELDEARHQGGGMVNGGNIRLKDATIKDNDCNGSMPECRGGLVTRGRGSVATVINSIIADNAGGDCLHDESGSPPARFVATDANLDSDSSCPGFSNHASPGLGPLRDNGGPTATHAVIAGSPPHNAGTACFTSDQRGFPRLRSDSDPCDIGAFELQPD